MLAGILVERRDELLFLVVVDDDDEIADESGRRRRAEIEDGREVFERGVPDFVAVEIVGEQAEVIDIDVDSLAVGDRCFRTEAVLAMTAPGRVT